MNEVPLLPLLGKAPMIFTDNNNSKSHQHQHCGGSGGFSLPALTRNMSIKKIHEVNKLSALISRVAEALGSESGI